MYIQYTCTYSVHTYIHTMYELREDVLLIDHHDEFEISEFHSYPLVLRTLAGGL